MLVQTSEWLSMGDSRFGHLFPAAPLMVAANAMMAEREWIRLLRLYGHVLHQGLRSGALTSRAALSLSVANARLVGGAWPDDCRVELREALTAVAEYAKGDHGTRRALTVPRAEVIRIRDDWSRRERKAATFRSIEAVAAVMRAAVEARSDLEQVRTALRVLSWAESAAVYSVPDSAPDRAERILKARLDVWRSALLFLDLAVANPLG